MSIFAEKKIISEAIPAKNTLLRLFLTIGVLVGITFAVYSPALDNDFVDWDDYAYVIDNPLVRDPKTPISEIWKRPVSLNYHPITIWTMRVHAQGNRCDSTKEKNCMEGISARPFIRWNIILHLLNVVLVFGLLYNLSRGSLILSSIAALWFGIHPMHVESVAWVSERKDVLYSFFFLLSCVLFARYIDTKEKQQGYIVSIFVLFILAILSKAMAVVLPVVMVLILFWKMESEEGDLNPIFSNFKSIFTPKRLLYLLPFFGTAFFFGLMAVKIQSGQNFMNLLTISTNTPVAINEFGTFKLIERLNFASYGYVSYIVDFFYPQDLSTFYPYPSRPIYELQTTQWALVSSIFLGSLALAAFWLFNGKQNWQKSYIFGIGFYFITVALVLQFLSVGVVIMADRYTYLPYIGLSFAVLMPFAQATRPIQLGGLAIAVLMSGFFGYKTFKQVDVWQDSETLWSNVINTQSQTQAGGQTHLNPNIEQAHSIRGHFYGKKADKAGRAGNQQLVKTYLDKAFEDFKAARKLGSNRGEVYEGLGNIYGMNQDFANALTNYSKAAEIDPKKPSVFFNRGITYSLLKEWAKAVADFDQSEKLGGENLIDIQLNRSIACFNAGLYEKALPDLDKLIAAQPQNYAHFTNRGLCKSKLGDRAGGIQDLQKALTLNPSDAFTQQQLQILQNGQ